MGEKKSDRWSDQRINILIEFYKERVDLFDTLHPNYSNETHRIRSYRLLEIWILLGKVFTLREISSKFRKLRTNYRREKNRLEKLGICDLEEQVKKSQWSLFSRLTFLNECINRQKLHQGRHDPSDSEIKESSYFDVASVSNDIEHSSVSNYDHSPPSISCLRIDSGLDLESDAERIAPRKYSIKATSKEALKVNSMKRTVNHESFMNCSERNISESCSKQAMTDESVGHFSMFVRSQLKAIEDSKERNIAMLEITQILTNHLCPNFSFVTQVNE